jgi:hypothetical protein
MIVTKRRNQLPPFGGIVFWGMRVLSLTLVRGLSSTFAPHCDNELFDPLFVCNCGSMG